MTKRKEQRRELLKEDDILSFLEKSARYVHQNTRQVGIGAAIFFAVVAALFWWSSHVDQLRDQQANNLYKAEKILDMDLEDKSQGEALNFKTEKERYEMALKELDAVIAAESGVVKQQAIVRKIGVLVNLGRQSEVEGLYQDLVKNDKGLKMFGLIGLGDLKLAEQKYDEARDYYSQAQTLRGTKLDHLVDYKLALSYKAEGNTDKARSELSNLVKKFEDAEPGDKPPIITKAQQELDELDKLAGASQEDQPS